MSTSISPHTAMLSREMSVAYDRVPHALEGLDEVGEADWQLVGEDFLLRAGGEHWFHYRKGRGVTIERGEGAELALEPLFLSGSVYSAVASINGYLPIHASAVCHEGMVYAVTGLSGAGKSTLTAGLAARGLPLFADDTLVLDCSGEGPPECLPGHKRLKLCKDVLLATGAARQEEVGGPTGKVYAEPALRYEEERALPLAALIFLEEGDPPRITPVTGSQRLLRLQDDHYTAQHYAAARGLDARGTFDHLARLAARLDLFAFARPFDHARLAEGFDTLARWIAARSNAE